MRLLTRPFRIAALLSLVALAVSFIIWADNQAGFREAGAFADLVAATFGMLASILLFSALLLQSSELKLQRRELQLQREQIQTQAEETRRLADYNDMLAQSAVAQNIVIFKDYALSEIRDIFEVHDLDLARLYSSMIECSASKEHRKFDDFGDPSSYFRLVDIEQQQFVVELMDSSDQTVMEQWVIPYAKTYELLKTRGETAPLAELLVEATNLGVDAWMLNRLPFRTQTKRLSSKHIRLILTAIRSNLEHYKDSA